MFPNNVVTLEILSVLDLALSRVKRLKDGTDFESTDRSIDNIFS